MRTIEQVIADEAADQEARRHFEQRLHAEILHANARGHAFTIVSMSIDHYENLRETWGAATAEWVALEVGEILRCRTPLTDHVRPGVRSLTVRYPDTFLLLLPHVDAAAASREVERLCRLIAVADLPGGETQPHGRVTMSAGVAELTPGVGAAELVRRAELTLFRAKACGRNRVEAFVDRAELRMAS